MTKAFWLLAAADALGLTVLLLLGLNSKGHNDGGREMGIVFFVILPMLILAATVAVFSTVSLALVRWLCLAVVTIPAAFYLMVGAIRVADPIINNPGNSHGTPEMRKLVRAVDRLDVEAVKQWAPHMDKSIDQGEPAAPLRVVIDKMVKEQQTRLPAQTGRHLAILKTLLENGARPNEALHVACWTRSGELLGWMFAAGADPNFNERYAGHVFFACLDQGLGVPGSVLPMVKEFVKAGVDVNAESPIGFRPATYAAECGNYDAALYLLDHGAKPDDKLRSIAKQRRAEQGDKASPDLIALANRL
jgi:hypothetical protein